MLNGEAPLAALAAQYGQPVPAGMEERTLAQFVCAEIDGPPVAGDRVRLGGLELVIRKVEGGRITQVGLRLPALPG